MRREDGRRERGTVRRRKRTEREKKTVRILACRPAGELLSPWWVFDRRGRARPGHCFPAYHPENGTFHPRSRIDKESTIFFSARNRVYFREFSLCVDLTKSQASNGKRISRMECDRKSLAIGFILYYFANKGRANSFIAKWFTFAPIWLPHWPAWMWTISLMLLVWVLSVTSRYKRPSGAWCGGRLLSNWLDDYRLTRRESPETSMRRLRCPLQIFKPSRREGWHGAGKRGARALRASDWPSRLCDTPRCQLRVQPRRVGSRRFPSRLRFVEFQEEPLRPGSLSDSGRRCPGPRATDLFLLTTIDILINEKIEWTSLVASSKRDKIMRVPLHASPFSLLNRNV